MTNHAEQAKSIFMSALERYTSQQWPVYLDGVCGNDAALRKRVEQLLQAHIAMGSIHASDEAATIAVAPLAERPGTQIGPYTLLEEIGEGGMGVVYVASQSTPVRRKVALMIIKPGMDSQEVVRRFEAERQALAMMDHPNIAKVFDGGATDAGRPYFAMELVQGQPIIQYCDREQLATRERLKLFVTLCHGAQHAHQKGVIHRDLKPSNLLVEVHDSTPVPKIIDFGIAKAMGQQLTGQSLLTNLGQLVGTPLYMSPEQASQNGLDIDTRSDIYSLGVVLYEMLTGTTPFEKDALRTAGVDEFRRIIREVDPPRPSARVSTLQAADLSTISERRHVEPRKLSQELRGELDWIVMKALDKDRDRRYVTANDLAADVDRYLHDEPVQACPPSAAYRFTKFARRNRTALVTSGLVAMALIMGTGVSIWQAMRATDAEQQSAQALQTAEDRLQFGRQAVDEMYTQVAEKWLARQAEMTPLQKQFLEKALAFYQRLATERSDDPSVRFETAKAQQRVGEIQRKLGQHKEADATLRQAREHFQQLVREYPDEPRYRQQLALTQRTLGWVLSMTARRPEAEKELRSALDTHQALTTQFPGEAEYQKDLADGHQSLGNFLAVTGRPRDAEAAYRQSIALCESLLANSPDDPDRKSRRACAQLNLVRVVDEDKYAQEEALYRAAIDALTALLANDPKNDLIRSTLAASHNNLGLRFRRLGRQFEAETCFRQAQSKYQELVAEYPQTPFYRLQLANVLGNLATTLEATGKAAEAEQLDLRVREIVNKLAADYPDVPEYQSFAGIVQGHLADRLVGAGKLEEARDVLQRSVSQQEGALKRNPDDPDQAKGLVMALSSLGVVLGRMDQFDEAETALRKAVEIEERTIAKNPSEVWRGQELLRHYLNLAELLACRGRLPEAEVLCRRALEVSNSLQNDAPNSLPFRMGLAGLSDQLADLFRQAKKRPEAEQAGRRAIAIQKALAAARPDDVEVQTNAGAYLSNLASTLRNAGQLAEARQLLAQAIVHQQAVLKLDPENARAKEFLDTHHKTLTELQTLLDEGKPAPEPAPKVEEAEGSTKPTPAPEAAKEEEKSK